MSNAPETPDGPESPNLDSQELLEHRDLQSAQIFSMMHVCDNPEGECWNNPAIPGWDVNASRTDP